MSMKYIPSIIMVVLFAASLIIRVPSGMRENGVTKGIVKYTVLLLSMVGVVFSILGVVTARAPIRIASFDHLATTAVLLIVTWYLYKMRLRT
jgi:hypothetical protein